MDLLTPITKLHATDIGCDVASIGMQIHGGMGYVEETGAARLFRGARIAPIYEGTNGIQAADLVGRKLGLHCGDTFRNLLADIHLESSTPALLELIEVCDQIEHKIMGASPDDRLAASHPFATTLATAVCGWLIERRTASAEKDACGRATVITGQFYLTQIVPEALGLRASAEGTC